MEIVARIILLAGIVIALSAADNLGVAAIGVLMAVLGAWKLRGEEL